ncbi:MAG: 50S ribosomal protein L24 [Candidatus Pacebacteria bacterium]|nr:50S ribosomal protein L24 [Candidatus Paceibacterota bacterium]
MKVKKGDTVLIISGKDRGKKGKIIKALPQAGKILVEGINLKKKHQRPKKQGEKGQIVSMPGLIPSSNAMLVCPKCNKPSRIGYKISDKKKARFCKKCKEVLE